MTKAYAAYNWRYIRRSEDVLDISWTPYVRLIYVLLPKGFFLTLPRGELSLSKNHDVFAASVNAQSHSYNVELNVCTSLDPVYFSPKVCDCEKLSNGLIWKGGYHCYYQPTIHKNISSLSSSQSSYPFISVKCWAPEIYWQYRDWWIHSRSSQPKVSCKKEALKSFEKFTRNTCDGVPFNKVSFFQKETPALFWILRKF